MSVRKILLIILLPALFSCGEKKTEHPISALDSGREFIQATRSGDFKSAEMLLKKDEENTRLFSTYKKLYENFPATKKIQLQSSAYVINKIDEINDSTNIINYSNGYSDNPMEIKIVRINKEWLVDLKYSYYNNLPLN